MPELPEVETIARALAPRVRGRRIVGSEFFAPLVLGGRPAPELAGRTIAELRRHGKLLLFSLDRGFLSVHLGMTGKLLTGGTLGPHTRAVLHLEDGPVLYDDIRMFGRIRYWNCFPDELEKLGPDPLEISVGEFLRRLGARRGSIKPLLLNQRFLRGMGNIYVDELLFRARIAPTASCSAIGPDRARRLHREMVALLNLAISYGGSSISDYVSIDGERGSFQNLHQVYGREGQPCAVCGAPIRRIVVTQRGTHFCPKCQRA
ncbi:MAG: bifunctional DNA-formamidopyrimidine glycosylase/DNA-(apurinic or apyrimidinic site) lyase [Bryobacteraceae bacterium]